MVIELTSWTKVSPEQMLMPFGLIYVAAHIIFLKSMCRFMSPETNNLTPATRSQSKDMRIVG